MTEGNGRPLTTIRQEEPYNTSTFARMAEAMLLQRHAQSLYNASTMGTLEHEAKCLNRVIMGWSRYRVGARPTKHFNHMLGEYGHGRVPRNDTPMAQARVKNTGQGENLSTERGLGGEHGHRRRKIGGAD